VQRPGPAWRARRFVAILAAICALLHGGSARAATTDVSLAIAGCAHARVPGDRLVELLRTEVAPAKLAISEQAPPSTDQGTNDVRGAIELCHGSPERARLVLRIGSKTSLERVVDLSDVDGELRVRTLAVAFAEMLVRLQALTEQPENPQSNDSRAVPAEPANQALPAAASEPRGDAGADYVPVSSGTGSSEHGWHASAGISLRSYTEPQTTFVGPWLALEFGDFQAEALFLMASKSVATGSVRLNDMIAAAGWAPLKFGTTLRLVLGVRGELGVTWAIGSPGAGSDALGATQRRARIALLAEPRVDVALFSAVALSARLSAGLAHGATATADHHPVATSAGPFFGAGVGLRAGF
jgi:hypothetical protein